MSSDDRAQDSCRKTLKSALRGAKTALLLFCLKGFISRSFRMVVFTGGILSPTPPQSTVAGRNRGPAQARCTEVRQANGKHEGNRPARGRFAGNCLSRLERYGEGPGTPAKAGS